MSMPGVPGQGADGELPAAEPAAAEAGPRAQSAGTAAEVGSPQAGTLAVAPAGLAPGTAPPSATALRLAEALIFAAEKPVTRARLADILPEGEEVGAVLAALAERYAGRGVELVEVAGGVAFRTAPDLAPLLTRVVETPRRLTRTAMEALAVIAWRQPVTRPEIEDIRGAALAQTTLESLLDAGLVAPRGRKEAPGRPTLWGTTPKFLEQFGLRSLNELPKREELLAERPAPLALPAGGEATEVAEASADAGAPGAEAADEGTAGSPRLPGAPTP